MSFFENLNGVKLFSTGQVGAFQTLCTQNFSTLGHGLPHLLLMATDSRFSGTRTREHSQISEPFSQLQPVGAQMTQHYTNV